MRQCCSVYFSRLVRGYKEWDWKAGNSRHRGNGSLPPEPVRPGANNEARQLCMALVFNSHMRVAWSNFSFFDPLGNVTLISSYHRLQMLHK